MREIPRVLIVEDAAPDAELAERLAALEAALAQLLAGQE